MLVCQGLYIIPFLYDTDSVNDRFGCIVEQAALLRISFDEPRRLYGKTGIYHIIRLVHGLVAITAHKSVAIENITPGFHPRWLTAASCTPVPTVGRERVRFYRPCLMAKTHPI